MPARFDGALLPEEYDQVENHTFRMRQKYYDNITGMTLTTADQGVIIRVRSVRDHVAASVFTQEDPRGPPNASIPLSHIEVGPVSGHWTINHNAPQVSITRAAPRVGSRELPANDVRRHFEGILTGISEHQHRLPNLNVYHRALIDSKKSVESSADMIKGNIAVGAPKLLALLNSGKNFDIDQLREACPPVTKDTHKAGIYIRIYSGFPKGSNYYGMILIYIGQSVDMAERNGAHDRDCWNKNKSGFSGGHYTCAREARKIEVLQLCVHYVQEGGSDDAGTARRDLMENVLMLVFGTYSEYALKWREELTSRKSVEQAILSNYDSREATLLYWELAQTAFKMSGWTPCVLRESFGVAGGLNVTSPFGGEVFRDYEKLLWSRQSLPDRDIFHRSGRLMDKRGRVMHMQGRRQDAHGAKVSFTHELSKQQRDDPSFPQTGETYWLVVEVMKPGHGIHEVPYFRLEELGCWDNYSSANKVAFKMIWCRNNKWYTCYLQREQMFQTFDASKPGALHRYVMGVATYAYFMRTGWPNPPDFYVSFGTADVVDISYNNFNQTVDVAVLAQPLAELQHPQLNEDWVADKMEDLGLQSVNGAWQSFDYGWTKDPAKAALIKTHRYKPKLRKICDSCAIKRLLVSGTPPILTWTM